MSKPIKVAIACQGGGSHTAFTAGVLRELVQYHGAGMNIVGFSGTSGGAICALLGWYGLRSDGDGEARDLLHSFWKSVSARNSLDQTMNRWVQWAGNFRKQGIPVPEISPYHSPVARWALNHLKILIGNHVDFSRLPDFETTKQSDLLISAVDVNTGEFRIFKNNEVTLTAVLASCAEPNLFEAVEIEGDAYWDGLFSKNPPVQDFSMDNDVRDPDEIWIVQINPQERTDVPTSLQGIFDRRNELAGNIAMNNEVRFLQRINRWVEHGYLPDSYTHTEVRRIRNRKELNWSTKLDRSWSFIQEMMQYGTQQAETFIERHPTLQPINVADNET